MKTINRIIILQMLLCIVFTCNAQSGNANKNKVSDEQLKAMNNVPVLPYIEASNNGKGEEFKILILGNSLAYHGIAGDIGWNHAWGMAASEIDKDYAHLLLKMTDSIMPGRHINMRISGIAAFERAPMTYDFSALNDLVLFRPDLIVIQIGENVSFNDVCTPADFKGKYISLIRYLKKDRHPLIICTTPFFPSAVKNNVTQQVASATKSFLVDLSHLALSDERNYAKNEANYPGDKTVWKVDGIGLHPGDFGMKNIARQIFTVINACMPIIDRKGQR
jgi:hypothetical protein